MLLTGRDSWRNGFLQKKRVPSYWGLGSSCLELATCHWELSRESLKQSMLDLLGYTMQKCLLSPYLSRFMTGLYCHIMVYPYQLDQP